MLDGLPLEIHTLVDKVEFQKSIRKFSLEYSYNRHFVIII